MLFSKLKNNDEVESKYRNFFKDLRGDCNKFSGKNISIISNSFSPNYSYESELRELVKYCNYLIEQGYRVEPCEFDYIGKYGGFSYNQIIMRYSEEKGFFIGKVDYEEVPCNREAEQRQYFFFKD